MEGEDRRAHPRYEVMAQLRVKRGKLTYILDVRNISKGGMFVTFDQFDKYPWFSEGKEVDADLFTTEQPDNVHLKARIVRVQMTGPREKQGLGVKFERIEVGDKQKFEQIIEMAATGLLRPPPLPVSSDNEHND